MPKRSVSTAHTNLQFLKEVRGQIPVPPNVESAINNTIGQGDTQVTLLQTALMVAAVANGGTLFQPMLVEKIGTETTNHLQRRANGGASVGHMRRRRGRWRG
ncbi:MAG UNVERIFIED_CONTAM: hypothetical protein LVT10_23280 [Anaerolineae bacterium]|jgi:cell division protein FtsI/penicillin-binding protein 2